MPPHKVWIKFFKLQTVQDFFSQFYSDTFYWYYLQLPCLHVYILESTLNKKIVNDQENAATNIC